MLSPTAESIRQGLRELKGKLIMIPGKVNKRSNKGSGAVELGPVNLERTKAVPPLDPEDPTFKHPVAFHPLVWTLKDADDDHCLALLLPLAEEGYNLAGDVERVRHLTLTCTLAHTHTHSETDTRVQVCLPGQQKCYSDVWTVCTVLHVYGPEFKWSNFEAKAIADEANPWAAVTRRVGVTLRDYFGWGIFKSVSGTRKTQRSEIITLGSGMKEKVTIREREGGTLSVLKQLQGPTRTLGPPLPIDVGAGIVRRLTAAGTLDEALAATWSHEDHKRALVASYDSTMDPDLAKRLGVRGKDKSRRATNPPCGLDLRAYLLQGELLKGTVLAPLLEEDGVVEAEALQPLLPTDDNSAVQKLWDCFIFFNLC